MSAGIMVYAVSIERLTGLFGSRDQDLRTALHRRCLRRWRGWRRDDRDLDLADNGWTTHEIALDEILDGTIRGTGCAYAYVIKDACDLLGTALDNGPVYPFPSVYFESADRELERLGVGSFRLERLLGFRSPIAVPAPDDFPMCATWTLAECEAAAREFGAARVTGPAPEGVDRAPPLDADVAALLADTDRDVEFLRCSPPGG